MLYTEEVVNQGVGSIEVERHMELLKVSSLKNKNSCYNKKKKNYLFLNYLYLNRTESKNIKIPKNETENKIFVINYKIVKIYAQQKF